MPQTIPIRVFRAAQLESSTSPRPAQVHWECSGAVVIIQKERPYDSNEQLAQKNFVSIIVKTDFFFYSNVDL